MLAHVLRRDAGCVLLSRAGSVSSRRRRVLISKSVMLRKLANNPARFSAGSPLLDISQLQLADLARLVPFIVGRVPPGGLKLNGKSARSFWHQVRQVCQV